MEEIEIRVRAVKTLLEAFRLERILYIIISCLSVIILLSVPIYIIFRAPDKIEWVVSLFVPAGAITISIGKLLKMWNQAINFVSNIKEEEDGKA
ncbi:hypothetical protein [Aquimarina brevivitae]|uniref:Uncharacterized protein n=1 Tax=Aquimarina brevivitae TaxID=323412 RepID=A0A4Q7P149_9FLAO|nr:hypothetical protein [Aquimarina brevivitae]RZS93541.1 hypothetical protein EV197_2121 [Aquimarina brevivitae]